MSVPLGGGAPQNESFVMMAADAGAPYGRALTAGTGLTLVDGGAGGNATLSITPTASFCTDTGTANAYAIAPTPAIAAYAAGQRFQFVVAHSATGASTLAVSGLATKALTKTGTTAIASGDLNANIVADVIYDGTQFQVVSRLSSD